MFFIMYIGIPLSIPMQYHKWTTSEEQMLQNVITSIGPKWNYIHEKYFPFVTMTCLKNKYYTSVYHYKGQPTKFQLRESKVRNDVGDCSISQREKKESNYSELYSLIHNILNNKWFLIKLYNCIYIAERFL